MATNKSILVLLKALYASNFVTYYKSHAFHFNIEGNTFSQDHSFFQTIYEFLQEEHDNLGEQIRQLDKPVTSTLKDVLNLSLVEESNIITKSNLDLLVILEENFCQLHEQAQELYDTANSQQYGALETYIGDYMVALSKLHWMIKATLKRSIK